MTVNSCHYLQILGCISNHFGCHLEPCRVVVNAQICFTTLKHIYNKPSLVQNLCLFYNNLWYCRHLSWPMQHKIQNRLYSSEWLHIVPNLPQATVLINLPLWPIIHVLNPSSSSNEKKGYRNNPSMLYINWYLLLLQRSSHFGGWIITESAEKGELQWIISQTIWSNQPIFAVYFFIITI